MVDVVASIRETARELVAYGGRVGVGLEEVTREDTFLADGRWVFVWREAGRINYNMQGAVAVLPAEFRSAASAFRGSWTEAGSVPDLPEAPRS